MSKVLLLAGASVLALSSAGASAMNPPAPGFAGNVHPLQIPSGVRILYNQNSNPAGVGIDSQNFTSGTFSTGGTQGADDFVVPKGKTWTVTGVDVSGVYFNGSGPAASEDVIFYRNRKDEPGAAVKHGTFSALKGADNDGDLAIKLPDKGLTLAAGTYWVSVIANCSYQGGCGEWGWEVNRVQHGNQAMWRNPGGCCCPTWETLEACFSMSGDFMFDLRGVARRK
jgi:hypothetical protein